MTPFWTKAGPLLLVVAGCTGAKSVPLSEPATNTATVNHATPPVPAAATTAEAGPMRAMPARQWSVGSLLAPANDVVAWLNSLGSRAVRIPVVMVVSAFGEVAKTGARVGVSHVPLIINLDDSRLGVSLSDRLSRQGDGTSVAAFLEGTWSNGTLIIDRVGEVIAPGDLAGITHIFVEATP